MTGIQIDSVRFQESMDASEYVLVAGVVLRKDGSLMKNSHSVPRNLPINEWANEVEQIFDRFLGKPLTNASVFGKEGFNPSLDISESEKEYLVHVDLPGVKSEDVKLEIHDDRLTISGKRELVHKEEGKNFHRVERSSGEFFRSVLLPNTVDHDKIVADFKDGVLEVRLPKVMKTQPKKITINSGTASD